MMFSFSKKIAFVLLANGWLVACSPQIAPVEQVQRAQVNPAEKTPAPAQKVSVVKNQSVTEFVCKNDVLVRVQQPKAKKAGKKVAQNAIVVTYGNTSHTLSPAVTKDGKKYSNIRWTWVVPASGKPSLTNNSGAVLAQECEVKW